MNADKAEEPKSTLVKTIMMYVVVEELIPKMSGGEHSNIGVMMFAVGFMLMMALG